MGLMGGGAIGGAYSGYRSARNSNKAQKRKMKLLQEGLRQFKTGSLDALGNKLSADSNGLWSYNLSNSGKAARNAATKGLVSLANFSDKSRAEIARNVMNANHYANTLAARANQAAAMRSGARTNSNLGNIATSFAREGSRNLRNSYLQGINNAKNNAVYNANIRNSLASAANNAMSPINSIQNNLRAMVLGLNGNVMNQYNRMAGAVQPKADTFTAALGGADQGFNESLAQLKDLLSLVR